MFARWIKLFFGFAFAIVGLFAISFFVVNRGMFIETDDANSIEIPVGRPMIRVGLLAGLLYGVASAIILGIGSSMVRANWTSRDRG